MQDTHFQFYVLETSKDESKDQFNTMEQPECSFYTKPATTTPYDWNKLFIGTPAGLTTTKPPGKLSWIQISM